MNIKLLVKVANVLDAKGKFIAADSLTDKLFRISLVSSDLIDKYVGKAYAMFRNEILSQEKVVDKISEMIAKDEDPKKVEIEALIKRVSDELKDQVWWKAMKPLESSEPEELSNLEDEFDLESKSDVKLSGKPKEFLDKMSSAAKSASTSFKDPKTGETKYIPASIILAMAAWESGWGKYQISGNYFGIKAAPTSGGIGKVKKKTFEYNGGKHEEMADFATFKSDALSAMSALPQFLARNRRYSDVFQKSEVYKTTRSRSDLFEVVDAIFDAGYSTDTDEPANIKKLISDYNLNSYD